MRQALISDIHGNLEALNAVLADIATQSVDDIICLGDIVGYGQFWAIMTRQLCSIRRALIRSPYGQFIGLETNWTVCRGAERPSINVGTI